jgi:glucose/mannose-6-phosphate isomerase
LTKENFKPIHIREFMKELVQDFTQQLREARTIASKAVVSKAEDVRNIVITGLGGSGIGGTIISELVSDTCKVPIVVNKDYFLPAFVDGHTLLIVCSYSGNTEETLSAMQQGLLRKAQMVCISSGGKVIEMARQQQFSFIEIPGGKPPRACLGYSFVQLMKVLEVNGFASPSLFNDLDATIDLLDAENKDIKALAQKVAKTLHNKIAVLYSLGSCEGVAVRIRQQINENSKMLCWHNSFPEMNHNELVGWTTRNEDLVVISLQTTFDFERTRKRYEVCRPLFEKYSHAVIDLFAKGKSKLEQFFYLINVGDWVSCDLADLKGIDPVEVKVIDHLKGELAKMK